MTLKALFGFKTFPKTCVYNEKWKINHTKFEISNFNRRIRERGGCIFLLISTNLINTAKFSPRVL